MGSDCAAVAYAYLAECRLVCLCVPAAYADLRVMGSSKHLVVGPAAVAALLVAAAIAEHAPNHGNAHLLISSILCVQVGLILFALRTFRMGGLVNLLSHPVITGFVNAAALLIIISQLPAILGIQIDQSGSPLRQLGGLLQQIEQLNATTLTLGVTTLVFLLFSKSIIGRVLSALNRGGDGHPIAKTGPLWAALAAIVAVWGLNLSDQLDTVGLVPSGLQLLAGL